MYLSRPVSTIHQYRPQDSQVEIKSLGLMQDAIQILPITIIVHVQNFQLCYCLLCHMRFLWHVLFVV